MFISYLSITAYNFNLDNEGLEVNKCKKKEFKKSSKFYCISAEILIEIR